MKKNFALCLMSVMAVLVILTGCSDPKISALKKEISRINAECPQSIGALGQLDFIKYEEDSNLIVYNFTINLADFSGIDNFEEYIRPVMPALLSLPDNEDFVKGLVDCNVGFRAVYKSGKSGRTVEITIPTDEVREMSETPMTQEESSGMIINQVVEYNKALCPYSEEGITMADVFDDGKSIVILCEVGSDMFDDISSNIEYNEFQLKQSILSDRTISATVQLLSRADRTLICRYNDIDIGREADITLSDGDIIQVTL